MSSTASPASAKTSDAKAETSEIDALETSLNDASGKISTLWTTFVTFEIYLSITFASVTHRDLLLERAVSLPLLNVELPLVNFFSIAPIVFIIFHFFLYIEILALAEKAKAYSCSLEKVVEKDAVDNHRQRLDIFFIVQFLAGPTNQRKGIQGCSLRIIAWITLVAAPVMILMEAQIAFLPYHDAKVATIQRCAIAADMLLTWIAWKRLSPTRHWSWTTLCVLIGTAMTLIVMLFSLAVVTFPGEKVAGHMARYLLDLNLKLHELVFTGGVDEVTGKPTSLFSDRLILIDQNFVDIDKIDKQQISHSFRGRDLRGAIFKRADLRKTDFTGADLDGAQFDGAKLQQSHFDCASDKNQKLGLVIPKTPTDVGCTSLRDKASMKLADLRGASLSWSYLEGIALDRAQLQGAALYGAHLEGGQFAGAQLQGASLDGAFLQGASFDCVHHDGSSPDCAELQGAVLEDAHLEGATFAGAGLQGARLKGAFLQDAKFIAVSQRDLDGGSPGPGAQSTQDTITTKLWRAEFSRGAEHGVSLDRIDCATMPWKDPELPTYDRHEARFEEWVKRTVSGIAPETRRKRVYDRLQLLDPWTSDAEASPVWPIICASSPTPPPAGPVP